MAAGLEQLVQVRSRLAREVLAYLSRLADVLDQTHWVGHGGERIRARDIAVEPFVLTGEKRPPPRHDRRDRQGPEAGADRRSPMDEIDAARYELPSRVDQRDDPKAAARLLEISYCDQSSAHWRATGAASSYSLESADQRLRGYCGRGVGDVRHEATVALGRICDKRAVPRLVELTTDESALVREGAAAALGRIGDRQAIGRLLHMATRGQEWQYVRAAAAIALWRISWKNKVPITEATTAESAPERG